MSAVSCKADMASNLVDSLKRKITALENNPKLKWKDGVGELMNDEKLNNKQKITLDVIGEEMDRRIIRHNLDTTPSSNQNISPTSVIHIPPIESVTIAPNSEWQIEQFNWEPCTPKKCFIYHQDFPNGLLSLRNVIGTKLESHAISINNYSKYVRRPLINFKRCWR